MSLWGLPVFLIAPDAYLITDNFIFIVLECLDKTINVILQPASTFPGGCGAALFKSENLTLLSSIVPMSSISNTPSIKIPAKNRIGPHNIDVLNILFGSLLGDCHAEFRGKGNGTRFCFYQESSHVAYLSWLHSVLANLGYCNSSLPELKQG
jgi:hypothetical protein